MRLWDPALQNETRHRLRCRAGSWANYAISPLRQAKEIPRSFKNKQSKELQTPVKVLAALRNKTNDEIMQRGRHLRALATDRGTFDGVMGASLIFAAEGLPQK